jgi:GNAT superfamily N-acetyltransferase
MDIRKATLNDSLLLSALCMDVQQLHVDAHPDFFKAAKSADFAAAFFEEILSQTTSYIFIAVEKETAIGYIFYNLVEKAENPFTFARRYLMIEQISVSPKAQGLGAGRALMHQAEITARELEVTKIELGSWDFNTNAHGFFEQAGYKQYHHKFWKVIV